ncbi:hypothetical protein D3C76_1559520 [compost metagenome]
MTHQRLQLRQLRTLGGIGDGFLVRPTGGRDALTQVDQRLLCNLGPEGADGLVGVGHVDEGAKVKVQGNDERESLFHLHYLGAGGDELLGSEHGMSTGFGRNEETHGNRLRAS